MKRAMCAAVLAIVLAAVGTAAAQEAAAPVVGEMKVPVRQYKKLAATAVYQAAMDGVQADVRFQDAYAGRFDVPSALRTVRVRGVDYAIALAFRTEGNLLCLVPWASSEALKNLFRLGPDQLVTPVVLAGPLAVNAGQQLTVQGAIAGTGAAQKLVLVDLVLAYDSQAPAVHREVQILWPGAPEPVAITGPGTTTLSVPCSAQAGRSVSVQVTVEAKAPASLLDHLAVQMAALEGRPGARKAYGQYDPETVYRHASAGNPVNVDFTDTMLGVFGTRLPAALTTVPVLRNEALVSVPTGYAFEVGNHLACLVPADLPTPVIRAASAIPGEHVRIRGTTVGRSGGYSVVSVDQVAFPDQGSAGEGMPWLITVEWPGTRPREFWDYGLYRMVDLPCQSVPGRFEQLQLLVGDFRTIKVAVPPAAVPTAPTR